MGFEQALHWCTKVELCSTSVNMPQFKPPTVSEILYTLAHYHLLLLQLHRLWNLLWIQIKLWHLYVINKPHIMLVRDLTCFSACFTPLTRGWGFFGVTCINWVVTSHKTLSTLSSVYRSIMSVTGKWATFKITFTRGQDCREWSRAILCIQRN